ncbi:hypothetical protein ACFE04_004099 [Oxalis oulophora]
MESKEKRKRVTKPSVEVSSSSHSTPAALPCNVPRFSFSQEAPSVDPNAAPRLLCSTRPPYSDSRAFFPSWGIMKMDLTIHSSAITAYYLDHAILPLNTLYLNSLIVAQLHADGSHSMMTLDEARARLTACTLVVSKNLDRALDVERKVKTLEGKLALVNEEVTCLNAIVNALQV